ncbi:hypothetical protein ACFFLS_06755 [Flavobacterium procerum]|uniref:Glycosyltransferase RgtA/B/C/D-like domain-containing protein n=1 Tax=Flavobacterium procerum TaxID=1455569 RepID=A0ABV6BMQ4_9FLAO
MRFPIQNCFLSREIKVLIVSGLVFRLFLSVLYFHVTIFPDSEGYLVLAKKIGDFNLAFYNGERSPGYPLLIALAFGSTVLTVVYQLFLGIIASIFWYKTILNFSFDSKKALWITLFMQSFLQVHFYERIILVESLTVFVVSLIFYFLSNGYLESRSVKKDILMGLLLGYLVLIKPFYAFLPFLIYGLIVMKNFRFSKIISLRLLIFIFPLTAYFGWSYVNKINTGYFVSTTFFGLNLSQNCVYFAEKTTSEYQRIGTIYARHRDEIIADNQKTEPHNRTDLAMTIWDAQEELATENNNSFPEISAALGKYAIATIKKNPKDYAQQVICRSWFDFWKPKIYWNYNDFSFPFVNKFFLAIWYFQSIMLWIFKVAFVLLIPFHLILFLKNRMITNEFVFVILIFSTSVIQALVTYGGNTRFSFPFEYMMMLLVFVFLRKTVNVKVLN